MLQEGTRGAERAGGAARARPVAGGLGVRRRQGREREREEKRESREREKLNWFKIRIFLKDSFWNMRNFEYENCRGFWILHFSFQAPIGLRLRSKVNLKTRQLYVNTRFDLNSNFLWLLYGNSKLFAHESCFTSKMLQLWFWAKYCLSSVFEIILYEYLF